MLQCDLTGIKHVPLCMLIWPCMSQPMQHSVSVSTMLYTYTFLMIFLTNISISCSHKINHKLKIDEFGLIPSSFLCSAWFDTMCISGCQQSPLSMQCQHTSHSNPLRSSVITLYNMCVLYDDTNRTVLLLIKLVLMLIPLLQSLQLDCYCIVGLFSCYSSQGPFIT